MNTLIAEVTARIAERSKSLRQEYLEKIEHARRQGPHRGALSCGNLAHGFAACGKEEKADLRSMTKANIGNGSSNTKLETQTSELPITKVKKPEVTVAATPDDFNEDELKAQLLADED